MTRGVYNRAYYLAHREKLIAAAKADYEANKEARNARRKVYRTENIERIRAEGRAGYQRDRVKRLAKQKAVRATGAEKARSHGLTLGQLHRLSEEQAGLCAICEVRMGRVCIDHDHTTGRVRGLLCHNCNVALGHLRDSPVLLRKAADYIAHHRAPDVPTLWFQQAPTSEAIA